MDNLNKLTAIDLNLLTVFHALAMTRSVTAGAKALNLSQPAMSHALARLRDALGDPLFVKTPREMVPTQRASQIAPLIAEILSKVEIGVLNNADFSPASLKRTFNIKTTDYMETLILPKLIARIAVEAPEVQISITSPDFQLPKEKMEQGYCDIAVAGFFGELPEGFYQQKLFEDEFVSAVKAKHPRLSGKSSVTLDQFCKEKHALIAPSGELRGAIDKSLKSKGKTRFIAAGLSSFLTSGWLIDHSDLVLTAPSKLIALLGERFKLHTFSPPVSVPKITMVQAWHERNHEDKAHKWLRNMIRDILQVSA